MACKVQLTLEYHPLNVKIVGEQEDRQVQVEQQWRDVPSAKIPPAPAPSLSLEARHLHRVYNFLLFPLLLHYHHHLIHFPFHIACP